MIDLYCAVCGYRFEPDDRHVWVNAETKDPDDRNNVDEFAFHPECWERVSGGWMDPA